MNTAPKNQKGNGMHMVMSGINGVNQNNQTDS